MLTTQASQRAPIDLHVLATPDPDRVGYGEHVGTSGVDDQSGDVHTLPSGHPLDGDVPDMTEVLPPRSDNGSTEQPADPYQPGLALRLRRSGHFDGPFPLKRVAQHRQALRALRPPHLVARPILR